MIGSHVPVRNRSALIRACKAGQLQKAAELLHKGGDCNVDEFGTEGLNSLHFASRMDHTAVCHISAWAFPTTIIDTLHICQLISFVLNHTQVRVHTKFLLLLSSPLHLDREAVTQKEGQS